MKAIKNDRKNSKNQDGTTVQNVRTIVSINNDYNETQ